MYFDIVPENPGTVLDGLEWYAEGATYSGSSPERPCRPSGGGAQFNSLTVKITTDPNNPEQIRIYTLLGGAQFYLADDGDGTYSLTQDPADAAIFDTPNINGSCLSNVETGTCMPLDGADGILPLATDINLPPIITEFSVSNPNLLPGQEANLMAMITDPEGTDLQVLWTVECSYFGTSNGTEFIFPGFDFGPSGQIFNATVTAPDPLNHPFESCRISLDATDADGVIGSAEIFVAVAASFIYDISGFVYGTDGLPLANYPIRYRNFSCQNASDFEQDLITTVSGNYQLDLDLTGCIPQGDFTSNLLIGSLFTDYVQDGYPWSQNNFILNDPVFGSLCELSDLGVNQCQANVFLPTIWAPLEGTFYPDPASTPATRSTSTSIPAYSALISPATI